MSPVRFNLDAILRGFPRVSGDEPAGRSLIQGFISFSPRERG